MDIRRRPILSKKHSGGSSGGDSSGTYTVNLNSQWEKTTAVTNPDSSLYDGVYRSTSNYNVHNTAAIMYINISGLTSFKLYIRSYAESSCDYVMVSQLDQTINNSTSYSNTTLVKSHTRGKQQSSTALSSYTLVEFTGIDGGSHRITVVYRKDSSVNTGDDRGYVLIPKSQGSGEEGGGDVDIDTTYSIMYTSSDRNVVTPYSTTAFGANITSNTYVNGQGIITFDSPVTQIGDEAFYSCQKITNITIPDSVTSIGNKAFWCCYGLIKLTLPKSLKTISGYAFSACKYIKDIYFDSCSVTIGNYAFEGCDALTKINVKTLEDWFKVNLSHNTQLFSSTRSLYINNVKFTEFPEITTSTSIGAYCFSYYKLLKIHIPKGIVTIGEGAFFSCSCTELIISNSVTSIGNYAFTYCTSLKSVTIPNSVTSIGSSAFAYCTSLTSVTIPNSVTSIGSSAFNSCTGELIINNKKIVETDYTSSNHPMYSSNGWLYQAKFSKLIIGNNITKIGNYTFYNNSYFTNAIVGDNVTSIGDYAFQSCKSLTSVTIPDSVTSIGSCAFRYCTLLTSVTIPDSVTTIGNSAFGSCDGLTHIVLGSNITSMGKSVFEYCKSLTNVTINNGVTYIWDYVFQNCDGLTSITIPNSVTEIGNYAFSKCGLTSITIPNNVTSIGDYAFSSCDSLANITINGSGTSIGDYAFNDCDSLTSVTIGDGVVSIGENAFKSCGSLTSVTIGDGVVSIGTYAFRDCTRLTSVYCKATTPPTMGEYSSVFIANASGRIIYVPTASVSAYKSAPGWKSYAPSIVGYDF